MLVDDPIAEKASPSLIDKHANGINYSVDSAHTQMGSGSSQNKKPDANALANFQALQRKDAYGAEGLQSCTPSGLALERKRQVYSQVSWSKDI